ncbi:MAG: hypothetical protein KAG61_04220, partial [Bacteriovoracaceae bacterium]|nr:hypothetical protein [Bacteriovoracaceae bacterium]
MYNIAIIECSDRVIEILKGNFLNEFKTPARCFKSFNDASEELKENDFQLVVCRNICEEEEESAKLLLNHLYDSGKATKVIVLGDLEQSGFEFETLSDRFRVEELNRKAVRLLGISKEELVEMKLPDYIPFPLYHFYLMSTVPCDIYIRIGKEGQDEKYVKRIHSENEFDKHAIKKYEGSG